MAITGIIWDVRFTKHEMGFGHPESPNRLFAIKEVLDGDGVGVHLKHLETRIATKEELTTIHTAAYVEEVERTAGDCCTYLDPDTIACSATWDAAQLAAGAVLVLTDEVLSGRLTNAFALVRPPGHHSERNKAMGFCFFNNIAIGAEYAKNKYNLERIAIIDFDVHHGNGTQHSFYDRPDIFFASIHRYPFYPGSGLADEKGAGEGRGTTLNIPLEYGATDDTYKQVFDKQIIPAITKFKPQLILVSAGYDSHERDPLGGMRVTTDGFGWMTQALADIARECCDNKLLFVLEGGYDLKALRDSVETSLEVLVSVK